MGQNHVKSICETVRHYRNAGKFLKKPDRGWSSCQQLQKSWVGTSSNISRIQMLNRGKTSEIVIQSLSFCQITDHFLFYSSYIKSLIPNSSTTDALVFPTYHTLRL